MVVWNAVLDSLSECLCYGSTLGEIFFCSAATLYLGYIRYFSLQGSDKKTEGI